MRVRALVAPIVAVVVVAAVAIVSVGSARGPARARTKPWCDGFDFPVGPPDAEGYYDAQPFGVSEHLGNDWNGNGGGDTDLGDPVHSAAGGRVVFAQDVGGGWGNVVRVVHRCDHGKVETLYAHLDTIDVEVGARVERGQTIGTIGDAHGEYVPHLHFELRGKIGLPIGAGYGSETAGYLDPTAFILAHRP